MEKPLFTKEQEQILEFIAKEFAKTPYFQANMSADYVEGPPTPDGWKTFNYKRSMTISLQIFY